MKIVIEARLRDPSGAGGVAQAIISLAAGLSTLTDHRPGEEFVFVTLESAGPWLDPYVSGACVLHRVPLNWRERLSASPFGPVARAMRELWRRVQPPRPDGIAHTDGLAESLGADVIHFPMQQAYITNARSIYQPHDLQHIHLPELFTSEQLAWRNKAYPLFSQRAESVLVESTWTKDDLSAHFDIDPGRIAVCPFPPATGAYAELNGTELAALKARIPFERFIFYPARTWPHKNHLALVEALAILRDRFGLTVPLVCSSSTTEHYARVEARIKELELESQILFIGFVKESELKALYRLCTAVVVPTKFESVSFPVWEAMEAGTAVACSRVTSLPAQVGDAGIIFNPDDPTCIANAVRMLWQDEALCLRLGAEGKRRFASFSLDRTARFIRALYRQVAGPATPEDSALLAEPPQI